MTEATSSRRSKSSRIRASALPVVLGDPTSDPRNAEDNSHAKQIFVGENSCAAMTLIDGGHARTGMEVLRRMWHAMTILHQTPWNQYCVIRSSDGGPVWGSDYYSNLILWAVPVTLLAGDVGTFASGDPLPARILGHDAQTAGRSAPPKATSNQPENPSKGKGLHHVSDR